MKHESRGVMKQQYATHHIVLADVSNNLGMAAGISDCNAKMMVAETAVIGYARLGSGKHEDPGLSIVTHFIVVKVDATFRAINHHTG